MAEAKKTAEASADSGVESATEEAKAKAAASKAEMDKLLNEPTKETKSDDVPLFSADNLPGDDADWREYVKAVPTRMVKIDGPFRVAIHGSDSEPVYCEDGYLAVDARGYPYQIATAERKLIYRRKL